MKLWSAYGLLQVAILLTLLITQPVVFLGLLVALPAAYAAMYLVAKYIFGMYSGDRRHE